MRRRSASAAAVTRAREARSSATSRCRSSAMAMIRQTRLDVRRVGHEDRVVDDGADLGAVEQHPRADEAGLGRRRVAARVDVAVVDAEDDLCGGVAERLGDGTAQRPRVAVATGEPEPEVLQRGGAGETAAQHADGEREGDQPDRHDLAGGHGREVEPDQRRQHVRREDDVADRQDAERVEGRQRAPLRGRGEPEAVDEQPARRDDHGDRPDALHRPGDGDDGRDAGREHVPDQVAPAQHDVARDRQRPACPGGEPAGREREQQVQDHRDRREREHQPDRAQAGRAGQLETGDVHDEPRGDEQRAGAVGGPAVPREQPGSDVGAAHDRVQRAVPAGSTGPASATRASASASAAAATASRTSAGRTAEPAGLRRNVGACVPPIARDSRAECTRNGLRQGAQAPLRGGARTIGRRPSLGDREGGTGGGD